MNDKTYVADTRYVAMLETIANAKNSLLDDFVHGNIEDVHAFKRRIDQLYGLGKMYGREEEIRYQASKKSNISRRD